MIFLTSCAGTWHVDIGRRNSTYEEKPKEGNLSEALSQSTGNTIMILTGDEGQYTTTASGFHYGFVYESEFLENSFRYYSLDYDELSYTYSIDGSSPQPSTLKVQSSGFEYKLGMKLWYLRPRISFSRDTYDIQSVSGNFSDTFLFMGYGVGLKFHVYPGWRLYAGWDKRFKVTSDPLFKISTTEVTFGITYELFGGSSSSGGRSSGGRSSGDHPFFDVF